MCTAAAFMATSSIYSYIHGNAVADATNEANQKAFERTVELVGKQTVLKQHSIQQERIQMAARTSEEIQRINREAERAYSLSRLSSAESGVAGTGVRQVMEDFKAQESREALTALRNQEISERAAESELAAVKLQAESTLASAVPVEVEGPSIIQLALGLGGAYAAGKAAAISQQLDAGVAAADVQTSLSDIFLGPGI